jgi:4-O-beta-D-mannosyl-D-glucose phosphorylase
MKKDFTSRLKALQERYQRLIKRKNSPGESANGVYSRYQFPILTAEHTPLFWRYDLDESSNPHLLERFGINAVFNAGAIKLNNKYLLVRKSRGQRSQIIFCGRGKR